MLRRRILIAASALCILGPPLFGAVPEECGVIPSPRGSAFEIGLLYQALLPSGMPGFDKTVPAYGAVLGLPIFAGTLQVGGLFGAAANITLYLLEVNYRIEMDFPYLTAFGLLGAHYLNYSTIGNHAGVGANLGVGLAFLMGRGFELSIALRTYVQQRSTIAFGGGFSFLL